VVQEGQILTLRLIKIDMERKRLGLSLKKVASAEYAEIDWQTAVQEAEPGQAGEAPEEIEDFDAALEDDVADLPPSEITDAELAQAEELEVEAVAAEVTAEAELEEAAAEAEEVAEEAEIEEAVAEAGEVVEEAEIEEAVAEEVDALEDEEEE
jgi:hypothetical protein